ncbi:MAG: GDP-mannose 4,6-dehydratase [Kiritimatiellia bacterium]
MKLILTRGPARGRVRDELIMQILVTGGAGFIGSHLTERFLERGDHVVILDNLNDAYDPRIKLENLRRSLSSSRATFVKGDILDTALLRQLFSRHGFDVVVHLAARAGVRSSLTQPLLYEEVNCRGTLNLLEEMRIHNVRRFVFASSSSVYGNVKTIPFREDARVDRPLSPYAATKVAGELYCYNFHHLYGVSVTALRFFTVYGPRQRPDMAIYKFTALINAGQPIPFYGDGTTARDYTYYSDIIDGVVAAVDRDLGFEIVNLGDSRTTTLAELVQLIESNLGKKAILHRMPVPKEDVTVTCADITKAEHLLGYRPKVPIEEGIRRFVEWYLGQQR